MLLVLVTDLLSIDVEVEAARPPIHPWCNTEVAGGMAKRMEGRELYCTAECPLRRLLSVAREARTLVLPGLHAERMTCLSVVLVFRHCSLNFYRQLFRNISTEDNYFTTT